MKFARLVYLPLHVLFVSVRRRELKCKWSAASCQQPSFVSVRRRELKYSIANDVLWDITFVSVRRRELKYTTPICKRLQSGSSSPYGDVS